MTTTPPNTQGIPPDTTKVPEVTLGFWIIRIAATTVGETGGDSVSMSMNLGYLVGTGIFAALFVGAVILQIKAKRFHPVIYWVTIIASTTVGTTLADFTTRSLGVGYAGGSSLLLILLLLSLYAWHRSLGSISVETVSTPKAELFYWVTIMFSRPWAPHWATGPRTPPAWDTSARVSSSASCSHWWPPCTWGPESPAPSCSGRRSC